MLLAACILVAALALLAWAGVLARRLDGLASRLRRVRSLLAEHQHIAGARERLRQRRQQVETVVDVGTSSVEAIHQAVAELSFDILGSDAARVRDVHGRTAGQVYDSIRAVNRLVGRGLSRLLGDEDDRER